MQFSVDGIRPSSVLISDVDQRRMMGEITVRVTTRTKMMSKSFGLRNKFNGRTCIRDIMNETDGRLHEYE